MSLRDLFVRFRVDVKGTETLAKADKSIKKAKSSAAELGDMLKKLSGAYLTLAAGKRVLSFIENLIDQGVELARNADLLGISTTELQKYQHVANLMHVPVQQVAVALRFFNRAVGEASFGTKSAATAFSRLGMSVKDTHGNVRPTSDLLFEFADRLQGVHSTAERTAITMRLLGRGGAAWLPMFQHGSTALKELFEDVEKLGGGLDEDFIQKANDVKRQQGLVTLGWTTMASELGKVLLPMLEGFLKKSVKTVENLIDVAKHTYEVTTAIQFLKPVLASFLLWLMVSNPQLTLLAAGAYVVVEALGWLYLAFDDFYTFLKGGDSLIGRALDKSGGVGHAKQVADGINKAFGGVMSLFDTGSDKAGGFMQSISDFFVKSLPSMIKWSLDFSTYVLDVLDDAWGTTKQLGLAISQLPRFMVTGNVSEEADKASAVIEAGLQARRAKTQALRDALAGVDAKTGMPNTPASAGIPNNPADMSPFMASAPQNQAPPITIAAPPPQPVQVTNNITVNGAQDADPARIAAAAGTATAGALDAAQNMWRTTWDAVTNGSPARFVAGLAGVTP